MPGTKALVMSEYKVGKSIFALTACRLGELALVDTEFRHHQYLGEHPTVKSPSGKPRHTPLPHIKKLLGIAEEEMPVVRLLQTNDFLAVKEFVRVACSAKEVITIAVDSWSILWDIAASTVTGRNEWREAKIPLRILAYDITASQKHHVGTAHVADKFNPDMTKVIGQIPWAEKTLPAWVDYVIKLEDAGSGQPPMAFLWKEVSGGRFPAGTQLKEPTFPALLELIGQPESPIETKIVSPEEATYRAIVARGEGGQA